MFILIYLDIKAENGSLVCIQTKNKRITTHETISGKVTLPIFIEYIKNMYIAKVFTV